jgi:hypothetical protein
VPRPGAAMNVRQAFPAAKSGLGAGRPTRVVDARSRAHSNQKPLPDRAAASSSAWRGSSSREAAPGLGGSGISVRKAIGWFETVRGPPYTGRVKQHSPGVGSRLNSVSDRRNCARSLYSGVALSRCPISRRNSSKRFWCCSIGSYAWCGQYP